MGCRIPLNRTKFGTNYNCYCYLLFWVIWATKVLHYHETTKTRIWKHRSKGCKDILYSYIWETGWFAGCSFSKFALILFALRNVFLLLCNTSRIIIYICWHKFNFFRRKCMRLKGFRRIIPMPCSHVSCEWYMCHWIHRAYFVIAFICFKHCDALKYVPTSQFLHYTGNKIKRHWHLQQHVLLMSSYTQLTLKINVD